MAIAESELFSVEFDDGSFITVFPADERLRIVVGRSKGDEEIASIDLDELNAGRLRRAIDKWLAPGS